MLPAGAPRSVSPSFTTYSDEISVTPDRNVITRASATATINVRLAMMEFPKAAVIGVIGESSAVPHDYTLDGVDLVSTTSHAGGYRSQTPGRRDCHGSSRPIHRCFAAVADEIWWFEATAPLRLKGDPR